MDDFEKLKCIELTNKMHEMDLCFPFREEVDPKLDGCPDYFKVITKPSYLSLVLKKLHEGAYSSIADWKSDIDLIWENAIKYNGKDSELGIVAKEMKLWFSRKFAKLPKTKEEEWFLKLEKSSNELLELSKNPPPSIVTFNTPEELPPIEINTNSEDNNSSSIIVLKIPQSVRKKYEDLVNDDVTNE